MCKKYRKDETISHPIENAMESLLKRMRSLIDTSVVVGDPVVTDKGLIIPISKVTVGFVSGGGEYKEGKINNPFAAGGGAGYSVSPVGFAVINEGKVKIIKMGKNEILEKFIESVPNIIEVIKDKINDK